MNPILYGATETNFTSYGLGVLECTKCVVEEERNGVYELAMTASLTGNHIDEVSVGRFIVAKPNRTDDPQPFRIYDVTKALNGTVEVKAQHLSYDLNGCVLGAISAASCGSALSAIQSDASLGNKWTFTTDRSAQAGNFSTTVPGTCRSYMGGRAGSILDLYGPGDWHFDKYTCEFLTSRGSDRGVVIRYGKNLTALKADSDCSNVGSEVLCYYSDTNGNVVRGTPVATGQTTISKTLLLDVTDKFLSVPTSTDLTNYATSYISSHNTTTPKANFTLDWVQSGDIIDRLDLCDTVSVKYEDFGISAKAKVVRTKWNVLLERYDEIEIGDAKTTLADTLNSVDERIETATTEAVSGYQAAIKAASDIITGSAGGYVVFWNSSTMSPGTQSNPANEILVMDTADISTAQKVWRWNVSGLGYSSTGYAGPYQTAIDMNGGIATWFIDTVRINADNITAGKITGIDIVGTDITGKSTLTVGEVKVVDGSDYDSSDLTRITQIILGNITPTTTDYERYDLYKDGNIDIVDWAIINEAINNGTASVDLTVKIDGEANSDELITVGSTKIGAREIYTQNLSAGGLSTSGASSIGGALTVGGDITAGGHVSPIGTILSFSMNAAVILSASSTTVSDLFSFSLPAGTWIVLGRVRFRDSGGSARQVATISQTANHYSSGWRAETQSIAGTNSTVEVLMTVTLSASSTTYYLAAGSSISTYAEYVGTAVNAVRIA